jgi:hypothetical protein
MIGRVTCRTKSRSSSKSIISSARRWSSRKSSTQKGLRRAGIVKQGEREGGEGPTKEERCVTREFDGSVNREFNHHITDLITDIQAPRQNRSSALRTGGDMPPTSMRGLASAANMDQAKMGTTDTKPVLTRRASVGVRSLGAPSIVSLHL